MSILDQEQEEKHKQIFLQSIISQRIMTKESITQVLGTMGVTKDYQEFIRELNEELGFFDFKIQAGNNPINGATTFCFINCLSDEISQLATDLSPSELQYFKKLVELIMTNEDTQYQLSSTEALNSNLSITPPLSKQTAEKAISKFIDDKWFLEKEGFLSFGVRTSLELHMYFQEGFDPFIDCQICKASIYNTVLFCNVV
jgi:non-structural maintenance of chromosomes element 1